MANFQVPKDYRSPPTGINVIIIGAGFAGLTAAIECHRKGHNPIVLESFKELKILGDIISFGSNAGRIFLRWPGVEAELDKICHHTDRVSFYYWHGEHIYTQIWDDEEQFGKRFNGHRGEIHEIMWNYAKSLGIEIRLGQHVSEYFETDAEAGVVVNGQRLTADVVLAADGVRSTARTIVLGFEDKPKSSGYAVFRAWMMSDELAKNPLTQHLVNHGDTHVGYLGPDIHFLAASIKDGKEFSWVCTHKDERDIEESWSEPGDREEAVRVLEGWHPICHAIVRATPPERLVDWKLVYRDPMPTWLSPKARIALIGDAAHPFLPTSIQGASQAMEDGVCLAACLQLAGKGAAAEALRAYERLRYERVRAAQKTGETTRDMWHKADFDNLKNNPEVIKVPREPWLLGHDAEKHTYENYAKVVKELRQGESRPSL
ncbi:salicylate hydroxylase [Lineolata rhizophorae]|uniref:Salicylate hydroxylase n=1 Tax=Lineolata rhizophorae TaxID=578093 RepID=A0A6A6NRE1_9PEZI|nr:salicylate hydroxylase [Lineolata rhizophorae]